MLAAKFEQHVVPNPLGYSVIVVNKKRSRELQMTDMTELIGEMQAFGDEQGIKWSDAHDLPESETSGPCP